MADLVTFTDEILNGKLHFLYSEFAWHFANLLPINSNIFNFIVELESVQLLKLVFEVSLHQKIEFLAKFFLKVHVTIRKLRNESDNSWLLPNTKAEVSPRCSVKKVFLKI